jgi:hypothetical protein
MAISAREVTIPVFTTPCLCRAAIAASKPFYRDIYGAVRFLGHSCTMPQPCFSCPVARITLYCNLQQQEKIHIIEVLSCQSGMTATWRTFSSREVVYGYESPGWRWAPQWSRPRSFPGLQSSDPTLDETGHGNRAVHGPESGRQAVQRGPQREVKAGVQRRAHTPYASLRKPHGAEIGRWKDRGGCRQGGRYGLYIVRC